MVGLGIGTYLLDALVRGVILLGILRDNPFVQAAGIYCTMQVTIML